MANDAALTVRIPLSLKRRIENRAEANHRSVSAQVLHDLAAAADTDQPAGRPGRFLGMFAGGRLPTDAELAEVRRTLWRPLRQPERRR